MAVKVVDQRVQDFFILGDDIVERSFRQYARYDDIVFGLEMGKLILCEVSHIPLQ